MLLLLLLLQAHTILYQLPLPLPLKSVTGSYLQCHLTTTAPIHDRPDASLTASQKSQNREINPLLSVCNATKYHTQLQLNTFPVTSAVFCCSSALIGSME